MKNKDTGITNWYAYEGKDGKVVTDGRKFTAYAFEVPASGVPMPMFKGAYKTLDEAKEALRK